MTDLNALIKEEHEILGKENPQCSVDSRSTGGAPCSEPFVTFSPDDMTGLAFSGGGIRSATFNLGLLKGLADCGLLGMFDYLSTVSGGGYIGSWWRLWLERERGKKGREAPIFPLSSPDGSEAAEVRRLRQFSNFLAPYLGFFEVETWRLAVALIAGLVPSLLTAVLLVAAVMLGWCSLGGAVFASEAGVGITSLLVLTLLVQAACEAWWLSSESAPPREWWPTFMGALLLGAVSMAFALVVLVGSPWSSVLARGWAPWTPLEPKPKILAAAVLPTCKVALLWLIGAVPVLLAPVVLSQEPRRPADALSRFLDLCGRTASRMLGTSLVWLALGMLWHLGQLATSRESWTGVAALLGGAAGTGGLFGLVSKFFDVAHERPNVPVSTLKKYLLMPLSYLAVGLFVAGTAALLIRTHNQLAETVRLPSPAALAAVALGALALLALTVHPQQTSLHEFYRARICRAYLAETNETCGKGLRTDEQKGDDYDLFSVGTPKRAEPNATEEPERARRGERGPSASPPPPRVHGRQRPRWRSYVNAVSGLTERHPLTAGPRTGQHLHQGQAREPFCRAPLLERRHGLSCCFQLPDGRQVRSARGCGHLPDGRPQYASRALGPGLDRSQGRGVVSGVRRNLETLARHLPPAGDARPHVGRYPSRRSIAPPLGWWPLREPGPLRARPSPLPLHPAFRLRPG